MVRKDNKLTKTHPVPNPTTNLHYPDRGIHTLIDIQMWASDSHQNKPKRFALVPKSLSRKNMDYLNTRVLPVLWFGEWFVKFAHICFFMFKQCRRGKSQRHTLTNLGVTSLFKFSCSDPTVFLLPAISFGIHSHNSCHPPKTLRAATKKNLSLAISYEKKKKGKNL